MPEGFQLGIRGPDVLISSAEEYRQKTGKVLDDFGRFLLGLDTGEIYAPQHLGVLNITGLSTGSVDMEFRSKSGGKNFKIIYDGTNLTIEGEALPEEIDQALRLIFTIDGQINRDNRTIHAGATRNLAVFDRDGNRRQAYAR